LESRRFLVHRARSRSGSALVVAVVAVGWSIANRGRGWLAAVAALLASTAALGWVAWTFLLLVRAAA
jgi:hypothetical protein